MEPGLHIGDLQARGPHEVLLEGLEAVDEELHPQDFLLVSNRRVCAKLSRITLF